MEQGGYVKIFGAGVFFLLLVATIGSMGMPLKRNNPQPLGILNFDPQSHDFGNMSEGETNSTIFEIWTSGGCCELTFNLSWFCRWITVFPTSGVSNGEHVPITVTVNTTELAMGPHSCGIVITTNGGGTGVFNISVNIVPNTHPSLAFSPHSYDFGIIPENLTGSTSFEIWNSGNSSLDYTLSWNENWVTVSPTDGSSSGEHDSITVTINTEDLTTDVTYQSSIQINSNDGNGAFVVSVTIGTTPKIEISSIEGGLFHIKAVIKNTGTADAIGINWKISLSGDGLILLGQESKGNLSVLPTDAEATISSNFILGLGNVMVTVTLQNSEALSVVGTIPAKLLLFYIKI
jgi:hypothetical protein